MERIFIVAAKRTPIGSFNGSLASLSSVELGAHAIKAALEQVDIAPEQIDEVIECHYTTGNWSIFVKLLCKDNEHLMELLNKKIQSVEGVSRTETFISLQQQLNRQINL